MMGKEVQKEMEVADHNSSVIRREQRAMDVSTQFTFSFLYSPDFQLRNGATQARQFFLL